MLPAALLTAGASLLAAAKNQPAYAVRGEPIRLLTGFGITCR